MNESAMMLLLAGLVAVLTPILVAVITIFVIRHLRPQNYLDRMARKYSVSAPKLR
jgi:cytochrome c biogenesis protein CcdA